MGDKFGYSRKEKREIRQGRQRTVAIDVYEKSKIDQMNKLDRYDANIFEQGAAWFNGGMSLESAPEDVKNNTNFIRGYDRAKRMSLIEESLYELGKTFFEDGLEIENIPATYRNSASVLKGYNEAKNYTRGSR